MVTKPGNPLTEPFGWQITLEQLCLEGAAYVITRKVRLVCSRQASSPPCQGLNLAALPYEVFEQVLRHVRRAAIQHAEQQYPFVPPNCPCSGIAGDMIVSNLANQWAIEHSYVDWELGDGEEYLGRSAYPADEAERCFEYLEARNMQTYKDCLGARLGILPEARSEQCVWMWGVYWERIRWRANFERDAIFVVS